MIRIKSSIVKQVNAAVTPQDLYPALQLAINLELATIPTYLTGLFTLGTNAGVSDIMRSVANEEMLHMCLAANTLIALGGPPVMNSDTVVPKYPGPLPGDTDDGLIVHLKPFSMDVVLNTYMRIEEPDVIIQPSGSPIPLAPSGPPMPGQFQSIGDFYRALIAKVQQLPARSINSDLNSPNQKNQVVNVFFENNGPAPAPITNIASAVAALGQIIDQGEGSSSSPEEMEPLELSENAAHFYRFAEIIMGKAIVPTGGTYDFSGANVTFDDTKLVNMYPDPTLAVMQSLLSSADFKKCQDFSSAYTRVLDSLNIAFNGNPGAFSGAEGTMFSLPGLAAAVLAVPVGTTGMKAGLCYEILRPTP